LEAGKKAAPLQSQTGEAVDRKEFGGEPGRKKQIKFCIFKKASYLCRPKREAVPETEKNIPEKVWKRRGRRLNFADPEGGRKTEEKKIRRALPGGTKKGLLLRPSPETGQTAGDCSSRRGRRRKVL